MNNQKNDVLFTQAVPLILTGVIFLILSIYGGARWMLARGDSGAVTKAKDTIFNALTGLIVVFASYAIATFVIDQLTKK